MTFPPDFIPLECEGMSILTAICLFFVSTGFGIYFWWDKREHHRINKRVDVQAIITDSKIEDTNSKVDLLFTKIDNSNENISEMNVHIARTREAVEWIKNYMEKKGE